MHKIIIIDEEDISKILKWVSENHKTPGGITGCV